MTRKTLKSTIAVLGTAILLGSCLPFNLQQLLSRQTSAQADSPAGGELAALRMEVERLKKVVPDQAHAMADVDYHFANLWFAGKAANWPLAEFYWKETVSHLRWAVRIIPVRKDNAGKEVKLEAILQSIENASHLQMGEVIKKKDSARFEPTYRSFVEACYACHKAVDKPYIHPRIPDRPGSAMMNFEPGTSWPK